jgi:cardiolipin synthase
MLDFWSWFFVAQIVVAAYTISHILRRRKEPAAMLAWIFSVLLLPFLGSALYFMIGSTRVRRKASKRRRRVQHLIQSIDREAGRQAAARRAPALTVPEDGDAVPDTRSYAVLPDDLTTVEQLSRTLVEIPAIDGNEVRVYGESEETYGGLESAIRMARHHVHLQYYIWKPDETGLHFRNLMIEKAREGVECRVLLDAVGCLTMSRSFHQPMSDAGVKVAWFLPLAPFGRRRWSPHLRNHRKIAVMDGDTAFVGSQNIGDEYRGRLKKLSPWYDSHIRVRGPAALFLQQVFAEDWVFATGEMLTGEEYFCPPERPGDCVVQIVPTGPDMTADVLGHLVFSAVSSAKQSIRIATPYFVPGAALMTALQHACYRGVRVQLVLPTRSDNFLALWAGRSFYTELLSAGAEIYEFGAGMLHSKIITIDDRWCMIGSANMDVRSFRLNFEITALIFDARIAGELGLEIEMRCEQSRRVEAAEAWNRGVGGQLLEGAARLFGPLL